MMIMIMLLLMMIVMMMMIVNGYAYVSLSSNRYLIRSFHSKHYMTTLESPPKLSTAIKYDGKSGASIEINKVFISIGNNDILTDINWTIYPRERWALVGRNGEGKSTLLKALTNTGGEMVSIRDGEIVIAKDARLGYLEQKGVSGSTRSVRDEVTSRMDRYTRAVNRMKVAEKKVEDGDYSDDALQELSDASVEFEAAGGYTIEQKISNVLKGLGFIESDYELKCSEFSGGWQMRIALARLLLSESDLMVLDEPTNHLDKGARDWLGGFLSKYDGTLLIVSHDETLLKAAVTSIAEVKHGKIELYKSRSHDQWLTERDERVAAALAQYEASQREIARLQEFVDRFGAKTMGASLAQSKLKTIEKLENAAPEAPVTTEAPLPKLRLPKPPRGSFELLRITKGSVGWSDGENVKPILSDIDLVIERGMRIAVRGPNGAGKSTLFNAISGELPLTSGSRVEGDGMDLGIFKQDLAQELDQNAKAVDVVTSTVRHRDPLISDEKARTVLGSLGLIKEKSVRLVGHLSGGEKARVALAIFALIPHNLLLLDEPSNHLDQVTLESLTGALKEFEGSCLVISHDRAFLQAYEPTHVMTVRGGKVTLEERSLIDSDWNDELNSRENSQKFVTAATTATTKVTATATSSTTKVETKEEDKKQSNNSKNNRRISKIETSIEKYEKQIADFDKEMLDNGRDRQKLYDLQSKKDDIQKKVDELYKELETL